ncbi:MAG: metal-dependent hydrolase [Pseudomonadota bacterium]
MKLTWLGHASWRLEIEDQVLLIDPWLDGNPMMEGQDAAAAIAGATHILVTHGHFDHTNSVVSSSQETGAPVSGMVEVASHLKAMGAVEGHAFNKGGSITLGGATVAMVPASHSSSIGDKGFYAGDPTGFMITGEGKTVYFSGDTTIMADMEWMGDYYKPDIGVLCAGGYYTMDMAGAAYAAKRYFDFKTVIPQHYRTFPALEQSADILKAGLPGVDVIEPEVMTALDL